MKAISKQDISKLLNAWATGSKVYVPLLEGDKAFFSAWEETASERLALDWLSTRLSPKGLFFPQTEKMYSFKTGDGHLQFQEIAEPAAPVLVIGMRGCDVQALNTLDAVFFTKGYNDPAYQQARERTTVISLGCDQPLDTCFCSSMGVDPMEAKGSDVWMYDLGDSYGFSPQSEKGEKVLQAVTALLTEKSAEVPKTGGFKLNLDLEGVSQQLTQMWDDPVWERLASRCIGCGTCTFVCPSCHCFDIQGKSRGESGFKYRCWDSCMYNDYTLMAGGHNPRPSQKERVRQRFMHKLRYFPERYGDFLCSGCGRCLQHCPVGIDIVAAIRAARPEAARGEVAAHGS